MWRSGQEMRRDRRPFRARWPRSAWPIKTNLCLKKAGSNRVGIGIIARATAARAGAMDSNANDFAETDADILTFDIPDDAR